MKKHKIFLLYSIALIAYIPFTHADIHLCSYDPSSSSHYDQVTAIFNEQVYWIADSVYFPITSNFDYFHHGAPYVRDAFGLGQDLDMGTLYIQVCIVNDKVVGFISYSYRIKDDKPMGYIALLAVKQEFQGHGFGRQLMRTALHHLTELGVEAVYLWTRPAIAGNERTLQFYKHMGFYEDGSWFPDDRPDDCMVMWVKMSYSIIRPLLT